MAAVQPARGIALEPQVVSLDTYDWSQACAHAAWTAALEAGKVLYFPNLAFAVRPDEASLLSPAVRDAASRNISLGTDGVLKGAAGSAEQHAQLAALVGRFRQQAQGLIDALLPGYAPHLRLAPTSYRPSQVETRAQSWRADDRRLHVDAFPSRPNRGERILRVFANINPDGAPRVWRVGEPFEAVARRFLPTLAAYRAWQAKLLFALGITKSLRSEYDHLRLQLHDRMKADQRYQADCEQETVLFAAGSSWVCFTDQIAHAAMQGQHLLEQTWFMSPRHQQDPSRSPLAIWARLSGHAVTR